ncbi:hypothetical protein Dred_1904 [Desulforamulus reducens MI-1]|uniref:AAA domain-containing protein n=1 Tax=Desulforamulus reducens (strain ATCC BAA-1160 / DSM 100696 / MI-1) TaxID=349161 RepID=A4J5S2_DESRM|nr:AAA family ATPase [Desulforamulus reducens]ABO50425.1 hypothetical protein Dred_1904 [Desulforamulus reducens MI-1]
MKTIVIHSIHKGEGKTKVAKELAGYLQLQGNNVLLADLDFITDSHRRALGLPSSPNLEDMLKDIDAQANHKPYFDIKFSAEEMDNYLLTHSSGIRVLSSENAQYLSEDEHIAQKLRTVVRNLKSLSFDVLIVDTDSTERDYNQAIFNEADQVLIVMDNFRYNVKDVKIFIHKMQQMDFSTQNFKIIFNKVPSPVQVTTEDIEKDTGLQVIGIVPVLDRPCQPSSGTEDICLNVADPKNVDFITAIKEVVDGLI